MTPPPETWIIGDREERRHSDTPKRRRGDEPVTVRVLVGVLTGLILAVVVAASKFASSSVVSTQRFEMDSIRRAANDSLTARDMKDVRTSVARTDTNVRCIRAILARSSSPFCQ